MEDTNKLINTRVKAREFAVALLFAKSFAPDDAADSFYAREIENSEADFGEQLDYIHKVYFGVTDSIEDIDKKISEAANGWSISRLSKTVLTIMRICIYEMLNVDDVPKRVALNEAVELAKKYDDDSAPAFVNGVLNNISRSIPDRECDKR
ncbi:MAG: transcription antitermination factor NusB [Clostridiales bacterium]|nr:transcription antitermination factor NusB [Clostridiales bacterium]